MAAASATTSPSSARLWLMAPLLWLLAVALLALLQAPAPITSFAPVSSLNSGWDWWRYPVEVNPFRRESQVPALLNAEHFADDGQRGWAVGSRGMVIATRDGGQHWQAQSSSTSEMLSAVHFLPDGLHGWAVGGRGTVIATQDGGLRWQAQASRLPGALTDVHFSADGQRGWAVSAGGTVIGTRDGGQNWVAQYSGEVTLLNALHASADGQRVWAVSTTGDVITTRDGGLNWRKLGKAVHAALYALHFNADEQRGWAVGARGTVIATVDGGLSWRERLQAVEGKAKFNALHFSADGLRGWAVGDGGTVVATEDGGQRWHAQAAGTRENLKAVHFGPDGRRGWVVGSGGTVISTQDGGQRWVDTRQYRRYPAPWFWLALLPVPFLMLIAWRHWLRGVPAAQGMGDMGSTDAALTHPDQDKLDFWPLARGISRFLRNAATEPPLTLAITGDWGTGKSSLMGLLSKDLSDKGYRAIWFNAWHHQKEEHLFAALLGDLRAQVAPPWTSPSGLAFRLRLLWGRSRKHGLVAMLLCTMLVAAVVLHTRMDGPQEARLYQELQQALAHMLPATTPAPDPASTAPPAPPAPPWAPWLAWLGLLLPTLLALRKGLTAIGADPAALLTATVTGMKLQAAGEQNSFRMKFAEQFGEVARALPHPLVIVIDDLDRCRPEAVLEIMEAVNFITSSGPCFVIFGMATERVQAALAIAFERVAKELVELDDKPGDPLAAADNKDVAERGKRHRYAADYLHKLINLEIKVPVREDIAAYRLLSDDLAQADARSTRQLSQVRRACSPWLMVLGTVILGIAIGFALEPPEAAAPQTPALLPVAAEPAASSAVDLVGPQATAAEVPPVSGVGEALAASPVPGQTSHGVGWTIAAVLLLGVTLAALAVAVATSRMHRVVSDSLDFRLALTIWTELVRRKRNTPRAIKRFGNRLRYFEMLQQGQDQDKSLLAEWRERRQRAKGAPVATTARAGRLDSRQLVAMGALHEALGEQWIELLDSPWDESAADALRTKALSALQLHKSTFGTAWPPSPEEIEVFNRLLAGVRMPGETEMLPMQAEQVMAAPAEESSSPASSGNTA